MISEYITINGINMWERDFYVVNQDSGLRNTPSVGRTEQILDYAINNKEPYFIGTKTEVLSFPLSFTTSTGKWSEQDKADFLEIILPENEDFLEISFGQEEKFYFVKVNSEIEFLTVDNFSGFFSFEVISNYPYSFSREYSLNINSTGSAIFLVNNTGDIATYPILNITKTNSVGPVSFAINGQASLAFSTLLNAEEVYIDSYTEEIVSSLPLANRYSEWNNKTIKLQKGTNEILVTGNCVVLFRYRLVYKR